MVEDLLSVLSHVNGADKKKSNSVIFYHAKEHSPDFYKKNIMFYVFCAHNSSGVFFLISLYLTTH